MALGDGNTQLMTEFARHAAVVLTETLRLRERRPLKIDQRSITLTIEGTKLGNEGVRLRDERLLKSATDKFRAAVDADRNNFQAHFYLAQSLYARCRIAEALIASGQAKMAARTANDLKRITTYEAMLYSSLEQWESALEIFGELIAKGWDDGTVRYNRAEALIGFGLVDEGRRELVSAFEREDDPEQHAKFVADLRTNAVFREVLQFPEVERLVREYEARFSGSERFFNLPAEFEANSNRSLKLLRLCVSIFAAAAAAAAIVYQLSTTEVTKPSAPTGAPQYQQAETGDELSQAGVGHGIVDETSAGVGHGAIGGEAGVDHRDTDEKALYAGVALPVAWDGCKPVLAWSRALEDLELPVKVIRRDGYAVAIDKTTIARATRPSGRGAGHG